MQNQSNPLGLILIAVLAFFLLRGPAPGPEPVPPPPDPVPTAPIARLVRDLVTRLVTGPTRAAECRAIAAVYRDLAAEIDTLRDPLSSSTLKRPADPIIRADQRIRQTLGARASDWQPARDAIADELARLDQRGEIGRSIYHIAAAFREIAAGLESVQ
jgi:hypothetical protein